MLLRWNVSIFLVFLILVADTASGDPLCDHVIPDTNCMMCITPLDDSVHDDCCDISIPDTNTDSTGFFTEKIDESLYSQGISLLSYVFQNMENPLHDKIGVIITVPKRTTILRC